VNIILLSGGSGKRLWPLSNDVRSKQFIKIFKNEQGMYESMVQRVYSQIKAVDADARVTIATSESQVSSIRNQLGSEVGISIEPCRRDTFPAIALAAFYLSDVLKVALNESVVVCPVDPYVDESYFEALKQLAEIAQIEDGMSLMGIEPTYPSEKYGYIIPASGDKVSKVISFKEKPTEAVAREYIEKGALWNGGIFAFRLSYILDIAKSLTGYDSYNDIFANYASLNKISFDYAVVEKESNLKVMRFAGRWKDLGTWNTLTEAMDETILGNGVMNDKCENVHIINEMDVPVLAMGLKDVVISASPEGILVSDKTQSSYIKPYVDSIDQRIMFAETSWGSFKIIDVEAESLTIKVTLKKGNSMKYHRHNHRDEIWTIIEGKGVAKVNGTEKEVNAGDVITLPRGCKHTISAITDLKLIEVQCGTEISIEDKEVFDN